MIMYKKYLVQLLILTVGGVHMNAYSSESDEFSGVVAKSIEVACAEFERKLNVKWENYTVMISEADTYHIVNFSSKITSPGLRGAPDEVPEFEIKIKKSNYEIIESQFAR